MTWHGIDCHCCERYPTTPEGWAREYDAMLIRHRDRITCGGHLIQNFGDWHFRSALVGE